MPRAAFWILLSGALILALSLGVRHGFGLFLAPMSADFGWGREVFAFAIALQNLVWGLAQPFTGALADRYGAARAVLVGGLLYALGLVLMGLSQSASGLSLSAGLLIGLGLSGTSFSVILGAVGRAVSAEQRSMAMGISSAAGSFASLLIHWYLAIVSSPSALRIATSSHALAWALQRPGITSVIFGARSLEQLHDNLKAATIDLPEAAMIRLDNASAYPLGYPYEFMANIQGRW